MPKRTIPLTDVQIRNIKPSKKEIKHFDGGGLFLLVTPAGGKLWRIKYRFGGKEKKLSLGAYPGISLAEARRKRDEARQLIAREIDPREVKKKQDTVNIQETLEKISREWHERFAPQWEKKPLTRSLPS